MIFKELSIMNFRSFENVTLELTNRNIIFGLNDIGKTNLLAAIRFLLDSKFRNNGLVDSDFYNKDITKEINITLKINIADDEENDDNKKIYTMMRGAITSEAEEVFIQLKSVYDGESLIGRPNLFWGVDIGNLEAIPSNQSFFDLDKYFNVVYIDSSIKLEDVFKKYSRELFKGESSINEDEREELNTHIKNLNASVGQLNTIKAFENELIEEYKKFKDDKNFKVSIRSEVELSNIHSKLKPYILDDKLENYPTSGDGRKKILAYTLFTLENRRLEDKKINIFLIEELENHLHRSMEIALSYQIFTDEIFKYLFMTTHSSLLISQMDDVNLIKLFKGNKVTGKSYTYTVPESYKTLKQKLNQNLAEAVFADVVLLVEGPSEKILFERILKEKCERYESFGGYILEVDGINFIEYYKVLIALGIKVIVKTDNDLKKVKGKDYCNLLGVNRCQRLIECTEKNNIKIDPSLYESDLDYVIEKKRYIYSKLPVTISRLKRNKVYLSKVDLENDLFEVIPQIMDDLAKRNNSSKCGVDYLQSAKLINMIKLSTSLDDNAINRIYKDERFECVKALVDLCCR
ncbi:ATP-dependent endonuclease [Lysinibacillus sp. BPa_S21]|uniref:ATP-dependent nuclease n=1 Tax=Lysinibacillus sp. BPa_S21 TaxID=2932478 RepID=UPI002013A81F|nr:TOPRIM nucleotidyl transferase/hydrolase domain-containing protein [Lysinibacillus sp. BPa_S21]MCL1697327.1 AAA family ATPase [Lysinibacillus sp. BPa_S21]